MTWRYVDAERRVCVRTLPNGSQESKLASEPDIVAAIAAGQPPLEAEAPAEVKAWHPAQIVAGLVALGAAQAVLGAIDDVTKARFFTAVRVRVDNPELISALSAAGVTIEQLDGAIGNG